MIDRKWSKILNKSSIVFSVILLILTFSILNVTKSSADEPVFSSSPTDIPIPNSTSIVFSPNGKMLAVGTSQGKIYVFSVDQTGALTQKQIIQTASTGMSSNLNFSADGSLIAFSYGKDIYFYRANSDSITELYTKYTSSLTITTDTFKFSPTNKNILFYGSGTSIISLKVNDSGQVTNSTTYASLNTVYWTAISRNGEILAVSDNRQTSGTISLYRIDSNGGLSSGKLSNVDTATYMPDVSPDGKMLVASEYGPNIRSFRINSDLSLTQMGVYNANDPYDVRFSPDGNVVVAVARNDGSWPNSGQPTRDASFFYSTNPDGSLTAQTILDTSSSALHSAMSPDGSSFVVLNSSGISNSFGINSGTRVDTTTTVSIDNQSPQAGDTVTLTANISPALVGNVDFIDNTTDETICSASVVVNGSSSCQTTFTSAGVHNIKASYSGSIGFNASEGNLNVAVAKGIAGLSLNIPENITDQVETKLTAKFSHEDISGTVTFKKDGEILCENVSIADDSADCLTTFANTGTVNIEVIYSGDETWESENFSQDVLIEHKPTAPNPPTNVVANSGLGQATVSWIPPTNYGWSPITSYKITSSQGGKTCTTSGTSCVVTGLTNGLTYTFTVTATNAIGTSAPSEPSNVIVPPTPNQPTSVQGTPGNQEVSISWTKPSSNGGYAITKYTVISTPDNKTCTTNSESSTNCVVAGLTNGKGYTFTVVATNAAGNSPTSNPSEKVTPFTISDPVTNVVATGNNKSATVSWNAPVSNGGRQITKYVVTSEPEGIQCESTSETSCIVENLTNGNTYTFTVKAINEAGESMASVPSNQVTPLSAPGKVSNLVIQRSGSKIDVSWDVPIDDGGAEITQYLIENTTTGDSEILPATQNTYTFYGMDWNTSYMIRVTPYNSLGSGTQYSLEAKVSSNSGSDEGNVNIFVDSTISLTLDDDTVNLSDIPGSTNVVTDDNEMNYTVTTNNLEGYTVTIKADQVTLNSATIGNSDNIPVNLITVAQADSQNGTGSNATALSSINDNQLYSQNKRSVESGDSFASTFNLTEVPWVNADDYTGTVTYTATVN